MSTGTSKAYGFQGARELVEAELMVQRTLAEAGLRDALHVPFLVGPPGIGKTAMAKAIASSEDLPAVIVNCGECADPSDVSGIGVPSVFCDDEAPLHTKWALAENIRKAMEEPCLILFDDVDKGPPIIQHALLSITANRTFRDIPVHPGTLIMGACNRVGDDMYARKISESLQTRVTMIEMEARFKDFAAYAESTGGIPPEIVGYLSYQKKNLCTVVEHEWRMPTPRSWTEAAQSILTLQGTLGPDDTLGGDPWILTTIRSKVGESVAMDFWGWYTIVRSVDVKHALLTGELKEGTGPREVYAAIFAMVHYINQRGLSKQMQGGLEKLLTSVFTPEQSVALGIQLLPKHRAALAKMVPEAAARITKGIQE